MNEFLWNPILLNMVVNFGLMIQVEAESVEDLGQSQVGQMRGNFFRVNTLSP